MFIREKFTYNFNFDYFGDKAQAFYEERQSFAIFSNKKLIVSR